MENPPASGLRSRSRSKTPFLRSSCDRENCPGGEEHQHHKSGRKTPVNRSTPVKQINSTTGKNTPDLIIIEEESISEAPAHRTRQSVRTATEKVIKTSDYSSEESPEVNKSKLKELSQKKSYNDNETVSTSTQRRVSQSSDIALSPIHRGDKSSSYNVSGGRSQFSPAHSWCSTDSLFAEQALADVSNLVERDPDHRRDHLPYRLYKMAGEYWNKYPKTDYTYSPLSKDRVELAPGQVAVPNMSRRSLAQFRIQGPLTSADEVDHLRERYAWKENSRSRKQYNVDSSDDEESYRHYPEQQRWWLTQLIMSALTIIKTSYQRTFGPSHRYPYTDRVPKEGLLTKSAKVVSAPFYWIYVVCKTIVTTTITTITETITPSDRGRNRYSDSRKVGKRRVWPWLLLLLLPFIGYGCYQYNGAFAEKSYALPKTDDDLSRRVAAIEGWTITVDSKLRQLDQKMLVIDNIEAKIEEYSFKNLQNNLIQILNVNENSDEVASKFKSFFDKHYMTKEQVHTISQEVHERLISSWKPEMDEDKIRRLIQDYLKVFKKEQMEIIVRKFSEYIKEVQVHKVETGFDVEVVKKIVASMLDVYDADKTGIVDFALESAGGQVLSTRCTELYQIKTKQYSILGMPVWWVYTSPRYALTPGAMPAECWAFQGFPGYLVIRTYAIIEVTGFSLEHMSRLLATDGKIESAPKNFSVYGLREEMDPEPHLFGNYRYDENGTSVQYFPVQYPKTENIGGVEYPIAYDIVELRVESNYGNPTYTCVYRFRVHGNALTDIRRATEDSIRESEL